LAVSSGTAAPLTFFATVSSVLYLGAVPVFADIRIEDRIA